MPLEVSAEPRSIVVFPEVASLRDNVLHPLLGRIDIDDLLKMSWIVPIVVASTSHVREFVGFGFLGDSEEEIGGDLFLGVWRGKGKERKGGGGVSWLSERTK